MSDTKESKEETQEKEETTSVSTTCLVLKSRDALKTLESFTEADTKSEENVRILFHSLTFPVLLKHTNNLTERRGRGIETDHSIYRIGGDFENHLLERTHRDETEENDCPKRSSTARYFASRLYLCVFRVFQQQQQPQTEREW